MLIGDPEGTLSAVGLPGNGDTYASVKEVVEAELGVDVSLSSHPRQINQANNRPLVALHDDIGNLGCSEDV